MYLLRHGIEFSGSLKSIEIILNRMSLSPSAAGDGSRHVTMPQVASRLNHDKEHIDLCVWIDGKTSRVQGLSFNRDSAPNCLNQLCVLLGKNPADINYQACAAVANLSAHPRPTLTHRLSGGPRPTRHPATDQRKFSLRLNSFSP